MRLAPSTLLFITLILSLFALALPPERDERRSAATTAADHRGAATVSVAMPVTGR